MMRSTRTAIALIAVVACTAGSASATIQSGWPLLAFDRSSGCELEIAGNGRFIEIRASGLIPGEALQFTLRNGDMKPIAWQVYAAPSGAWRHVYIPFRFNRDGGTVAVHIAASRCSLMASVPWSRQFRTIE
ncbi:MAG: hypothetical protein J0M19_10810 [Sphingomonadales bacterium]|nr:hypothetical protein [Sphingomonadales bacterium]